MRQKAKVEVVNKLTESQIRDARVDEIAEEQRRVAGENLKLRTMVIALRKKMAEYEEILDTVDLIQEEIAQIKEQVKIVTTIGGDLKVLKEKLTHVNKSKNKA